MINNNSKTPIDNANTNNISISINNKDQNQVPLKHEASSFINETVHQNEQRPFLPQLRPFPIPDINFEYLQDISRIKAMIGLEDISFAMKYSLREIFNLRNLRFRSEFNQFPFTMNTPVLFKGEDITHYTSYPMMTLTKDSITIVQYRKSQSKLKHKVSSLSKVNESTGSNTHSNNVNNKTSAREAENNTVIGVNSNSNGNNNNNDTSQHNNNNQTNGNCNNINGNDNYNTHTHNMISLNDIYDFNNPIFHLNFNYVTTSFKINPKKHKIVLTVLSLTNKHFYIKLHKNQDISLFKKIVLLLYNAITNSKGSKTNLLGVSLRNNFNKYYFITSKEFEEKAKTGDILIFRGFEFAAKLQRFYTKSEYDHVALLTKDNGILYVYEATSKEGCKQRPWKDFLLYLWNLLYEKIVYRELVINIDNEMERKQMREVIERKAEGFLKKTHGKDYHLSLCSILCCSKEKEYEKENKWEESKGFSCSSLLSGAYLNMGIIKYDKDIDTSLPGDFSKEKNFKMNKPFELGPEIIIDFTTN